MKKPFESRSTPPIGSAPDGAFHRWLRAGLACLLPLGFAQERLSALNLETVVVGDPGNAADDTGFGATPSSFAIGTYEVTNAQYAEFLNAVDPNGVNPNGIFHTGMHNEARGGILFRPSDPVGGKYTAKANMTDKPVNFVNWFDAARFVNWLHHGKPVASSTAGSHEARETGTYTLNNALTGTILRNPGAKWWIPSESEWYKAAYYKGGGTNAGYWDYPTRSQSYAPPSSITADSSGNGPGGSGNRANFNKTAAWNPSTEINASAIASPTTVGTNGGPSVYGAFDMGGNVMEINDGVFSGARGRRGGGYDSTVEFLSAAQRGTSPFSNDTVVSLDGTVVYTMATMQQGFRVATGIEPVLGRTVPGVIYSNAVAVSSQFTDGGGATVVERGFIHGPGDNPEPLLSDQGVVKVVVPGTAQGAYSTIIKSLSPGQSYTIRAFATSAVGTGYGPPVPVTVLGSGANAAPTDIVLSAGTITEGAAAPTVIGSFTAVDADINDYHGFALQAGEGATDNGLFRIQRSGEVWNLVLNSPADFETKSSYSIRVYTADNGTGLLGFSKVFTLAVTDVNESPVITSQGGSSNVSLSLAENLTVAATVTATDPDLPAQSLSFAIAGGKDAALFRIDAGTGVLAFGSAPDFEQPNDSDANNQYEVTVAVADSGSPSATATQAFVITITDTPEAPALADVTALPLSDKRAVFNATVPAAGAGTVSVRGFVVAAASSTTSPVLGGNGVIDIPVSGTTGAFDAMIASLSASTDYVVRAYATNAVGTGYSAALAFTTLGPDTAPQFNYPQARKFSLLSEADAVLPATSGGRMPGQAFRNVTTLAGNGTSGATNGTLAAARFNRPWGLALDGNGNLYVADDGNQKIRRILPNGVVSDFGAGIQYPRAVVVDGNNQVYVASNNHAIYRITQAGTTTVFAGAVNTTGSTDSATPTAARFNNIEGLAIDPTRSYLLVADRANNKIRRIDLATGAVTTFAGSSSNTAGIEDGPALTTARFKAPFGVAFAPDGNTVYVAEVGSATVGADATDRIRKITLASGAWTVSTLAGGTANAGPLDGSGTNARFNEARNIAVDPLGNLYVGDGSNHAIRKITPEGEVSTLAGSLLAVSGNVNGVGNEARFNDPRGLVVDPAGFLYVSDTNNHQIRRISLGGYEIIPPLPKGMTFNASTGAIGGRPEEFSFASRHVQDFNSPSPAGTSLSGHAALAGNLLRVTPNAGSQLGAFTVNGSGANAADYRVTFNLITTKASGGADGVSYSFAADGNATATSPAAEIGTGSGLSLSFSTYNNNAGIRLYYGATKTMGTTVGSGGLLAYSNNAAWRGGIVPVVLRIDEAGRATVSVNGTEIFTNVQLPEAFIAADRSAWTHMFKARTGASTDMHAIDNLAIQEGRAAAVHRVTAYNLFGSHTAEVTVDVGFSPVLAAGSPFITATGFKASGIELGSPALSAVPAPHAVLTLVNNTGAAPVAGTFSNLPEGSTVASTFNGDTFHFRISYSGGDGNDIVLTRVSGPGQRDHCLVTTFAGANRATADLLRPYGLAHDRLGNLYATDHNKHQIVKITPDGTLSVFAGNGAGHADGAASTAKFYSPMGLALDSQGSVYVADMWTHRIRKITQAGLQSTTGSLVTTVGGNGTAGSADGDALTSRFNYPYSVKVDAADTVYVADTSNSAVRKISTTGVVTTVAPPPGKNFPSVRDILPEANGDFLASIGIYSSSTSNGTTVQFGGSILRFTASPVALSEFSGGIVGFADGPAASAKFSSPYSIARDPVGRIWVADSGNHRIRRVAPDGSVETMAGSVSGNADGLGTAALFNGPSSLSIDPAGVVYVADTSNFLIRKIVTTARPFLGSPAFTKAGDSRMRLEVPVIANGLRSSVSLTYQAPGLAPVTVPVPLASPASVDEQTAGITLEGVDDNTVYSYTLTVANADGPVSKAGTFVLLDPSFTPERPVILAANGFNASGIPLGKVSLGFAPVPHQSLLLVDNFSSTDIQGAFTGVPEGTVIPVSFGGNTFDLQLSYKGGDGNDITLMRVAKAGQISNGLEWRVTTVAGHLPGNPMFQPWEVVRDASGNLFVTDWGAHVIWKVSPEGVISNFAGYLNASGTQNGTGQNARFYNPHSMVIDAQGNLFVSDTSNHAIRKITPAGVVTTFAGVAGSSGSAGGAATSARFSSPRGMTIDRAGNLFVVDGSGLRKVTPEGVVSTLPAGQFYNPDNVGLYADGTPVVSQAGAYSIARVNGNGTNTILAGNTTTPGSVDGTGTAARFGKSSLSRSAIHFSIDPLDNLYAADTLNHTIRRITPDGVVTTIAGVAGPSGFADGIGFAARFYEPRGVHFSPSGDMYVVDTFNKRIRRMTAGALPVAALSSPAGVSPTRATLRGTVNPNGFVTTARFEYGTTTAFGSSVDVLIGDPAARGGQPVTAEITGLAAGQTYHYRLVATNVDGTTTTVTGSFPATNPPSFAAAPEIPSTSYQTAVVSSVITDDGGVPVLERGILFDLEGSSADLVVDNPAVRRVVHGGTVTSPFLTTATSLKPNTRYRVRAYATTAAGTGYSPLATFQTGPVRVESVAIGDPGNANDVGTSYGAVAYEYRMGRYEVTNLEYVEFLNAVDPDGTNPAGIYATAMTTDPRGGILFDAAAAAGARYSVKDSMGGKPVVHVSWFEAARFSNWVHGGYARFPTTAESYAARETGAYPLMGATSGNFARNPRASAWIPSESEWFKAAYFNKTSVYLSYATSLHHSAAQADVGGRPLPAAADPLGNGTPAGQGFRINWLNGAQWNGQTGNVVTVGTSGGGSYYGTHDQDGNVDEWTDTVGSYAGTRVTRGGNWSSGGGTSSGGFYFENPSQAGKNERKPNIAINGRVNTIGFRIAMAAGPIAPSAPYLVQSVSSSSVAGNTAVLEGVIADPGGEAIVERGFVISATLVNPNPQIGGNGVVKVVADLSGGISFTAVAAALKGDTAYTFRAYATNSLGTGYSGNGTFTTLQEPPVIAYESPVNLPPGQPASLQPVNTGGQVPVPTAAGNTTANTRVVSTLAGSTQMGLVNATGAAARFKSPIGVDVDSRGTVYVADMSNNLIRKITASGVVSTLAGTGTSGAADGPAATAEFSSPVAVAVDGQGNVYVAEQTRLRRITSSGVVSTLAGGDYGSADGTGAAAQFAGIAGMDVDALGNIWLVDSYNHSVRRVTPEGVVTTIAGGTQGSADGTGSAAMFNSPQGVAVSPDGSIYVADTYNHTIRRVSTDGVVTTFAGSRTQGTQDGKGTAAMFKQPIGIDCDAGGNLYVADYGNARIRKITPQADVSTLAGSTNAYSNPVNGPASSATFSLVYDVCVGPAWELYVADFQNHQIRKITPAGYTIDRPLPAGLAFNSFTGAISGTPVEPVEAADYTITAHNQGGSSSFVVNLAVTVPGSATKPLLGAATAGPGVGFATAGLSGSVTADGGAAVTERGFVLAPKSVNPAPQIGGNAVSKIVAASAGTGAYGVEVTGLSPSTEYVFRAYATNAAGTAYGTVGSFTTAADPAVLALAKIAAYAGDGTAPAPDLADFAAAGVTGVTGANLAAVRSALASAAIASSAADSAGEVQKVVDAWIRLLAEANGASVDATPGNDPAGADYLAIGATTAGGLGTNALALLNSVIATKDASAIASTSSIEALAAVVSRVALAASGAVVEPSLSPADFAALGVTGVDGSNLAAVIAALEQTADDGAGIAGLSLLQGVVDSLPRSGGITLADWRQTHFGTTLDAGAAANLAAPAGDGIANLVKYGLSLDPTKRSRLPLPRIEANRLKLDFLRDPLRTDARIVVEGSSDTVQWSALATSAGGAPFTGAGAVVERDAAGGLKQVEVSDTVDASTAPRRLLRVRVTLDPAKN